MFSFLGTRRVGLSPVGGCRSVYGLRAVQEVDGLIFLLLPPSGVASFERGAENDAEGDADSQLIHRDADRHAEYQSQRHPRTVS